MKFAEIPHFILTAYIKRANELAMDIGDAKETSLRTINPDFIYQDSSGVEWKDTIINGNTEFTWSGIQHDTWQVNSYIMGPRTSIVTDSGEILSLYYKDEMGSFQPIRMISDGHSMSYNTEKQHDFFDFNHIQNYNRESDLLTTIDEEYHTFKIYDIWNNKIELPNGAEIYFRKDSLFHQWLKNYGASYLKDQYGINFLIRNYINIDKPYIYLGTLYKNNAYDIYFRAKTDNPIAEFFNYMHKRAMLPQNAYHLLYYNIRNFVIDCIPEHQRTENFRDFLYYNFDILYNEVYSTQKDIPNAIDPYQCNYEFLWDLCKYYNFNLDDIKINDEQIKRNFTAHIPYLLKKRGTYSSIYAIWKIITGNNPNRFNIYERWHEVPLTYTQHGQNYVVQKDDYMDWLHTSFYGVTDYESGVGEEYYTEYFNDELYPKLGTDLSFEGNKVIHNMNDIDLIIELYNEDGIRILPENISTKYSHFAITPFEGIAVIKKGINVIDEEIDINNHIVNLYKDSNKILWNKEKYFDADRIVVTEYDYKQSITDDSTLHIINHNLGQKYIISSIYDNEGIPILPKSLRLIDENALEIEFYKPISGNILICKSDKHLNLGYELTLSTQYRVEPDITDYPVEKNSVFSKEICDSLYTVWEYFKPSNRTVDYKILLAPKSDLTGEKTNNYDINYAAQLKTHTNYPVEVLQGTYIEYTKNSISEIKHNLNSNELLIEIYDKNFNKLYDEVIEVKIIDDDNIKVEVNEPIEHFVLIKRCDTSFSYENLDDNQYRHSMNTTDIFTQFFKDNEVIYPEMSVVNENVIYTDNEIDNFTVMESDVKIMQLESDTTWSISHSLNSRFLFVESYNENGQKIPPSSLNIIDKNNIEITFSEPVKGYTILKKIGQLIDEAYLQTIYYSRVTAEDILINHGLNSKNLIIYLYDSNYQTINPDILRTVDSDNVRVKFSEETTFYITMRISPDVENFEQGFLLRCYYNDNKMVYPSTSEYVEIDNIIRLEPDRVMDFPTSDTIWNVNHNMNYFGLMVDVYDNDNLKIKPKSVKIIDSNNIEIKFDINMSGRVMLSRRDSISTLQENNDVVYEHGLNSNQMLFSFYNNENEMIIPEYIEILDNNSIRVKNEDPFYILSVVSDYVHISEEEETNKIKQYHFNDDVLPLGQSTILYEKAVLLTPSLIIEIETESDVWEIEHNLACFGVVVDIYNEINEKVEPEKVELIDHDNIKVYFSEPVKGKILVSPFFTNEIKNEPNCFIYEGNGTIHNINHNLDTDKIIICLYDKDFNMASANNIEIIDSNNIEITFLEDIEVFVLISGLPVNSWPYIKNYPWLINTSFSTNNVIINTFNDDIQLYTDKVWKYDKYLIIINDRDINKVVLYQAESDININTPQSEWNITHNYDGIGVIGDFYDENGRRITTNSIKFEDKDSYKVTFDGLYEGNALTTYIGDMALLTMRELLEDSKIWISDYKDEFQTNKLEFDVKYVKENDNYFYININIPKNVEMIILEMGIISKNDEIIYYTDVDNLYKHKEFDLNLFYIIEKKYKIVT